MQDRLDSQFKEMGDKELDRIPKGLRSFLHNLPGPVRFLLIPIVLPVVILRVMLGAFKIAAKEARRKR